MLLRIQHASLAQEDQFDLESDYRTAHNKEVKAKLTRYINNVGPGIKICPDLLKNKIYGCFDYLQSRKNEAPETAAVRAVTRRRYTRRTSVRMSVL